MAARGPALKFPPPGIYGGVFLVGLLLETVWRLPIARTASGERVLEDVGTWIVIAAIVLALWGVATFWLRGTSVLPFKPTAALVRTGPYRFTRNPMYLGMTLAHLGLALAMNTGWALLLLPVAVYLIVRLVIRVEEKYLGRVFGDEYAEFRRRVRRWI